MTLETMKENMQLMESTPDIASEEKSIEIKRLSDDITRKSLKILKSEGAAREWSSVVIVLVIFMDMIPLLMCCITSHLSNKPKQCILKKSNN